ncbi:bifunctional glutamate--cysteine ligase GshA/glutathione synthetase GshB [Halosquirtibacter xylanolyticus]|uniref:bifunctional glutamate--cysteine ligase GshA/glutathione synthetase GshB n=1 Tax=Halosquirtibacter xylanolyticus TaxID=3374599 RepID=UPI0037499D0F|nr:bifunctional glutamate--cysteine ligase GshA/glutathione synthetase GshB [Prolixibacteraceae bacterium]
MEQWLKNINKQAPGLLLDGLFGLEKEALRVDEKGLLSLFPHPKSLGDKSTHAFITTDFSESQIELISPPMSTIKEALGFIETAQDIVFDNIDDEYLWPQSLPCLLPDSHMIPIAKFTGDHSGKQDYREYLLDTYGPEVQTFSGIHFNVSLSDEIWTLDQSQERSDLKPIVYMKMMRNFIRYRWILIWLFGASPIADGSLKVKKIDGFDEKKIHPVCLEGVSIRSGRLGYRNHELIELDYSTWDRFKKSIDKHVKAGRLIGPQELYLPIRIKTINDDISHVEVRLLDIDPFEQTGINIDTLRFVHLFLLHMLLIEERDVLDVDKQKQIQDFQDWICCNGLQSDGVLPNDSEVKIKDVVRSFIRQMVDDFEKIGLKLPDCYVDSLAKVESLSIVPDNRVAVRLVENIQREGFVAFHMKQAKKFKLQAQMQGYQFHGLEDMELSTQLLLRAALHRGVHYEIMDRQENFIRLFNATKEEYVVQATKTSLDPYSVVLMMENKTVTKKVLNRAGIHVPSGNTYDSLAKAKSQYVVYRSHKLVVKPQSTNFGLGITILHPSFSESDYAEALDLAFRYDKSVLVEHFIEGEEYRIFLIDKKVVAVLKRVPANVLGDGSHTIKQLVELKNLDPLRGKGYRTPLEKLHLGAEEIFFLKQTGHTPLDIPKDGEVVYLRENSNISTGGDSIDYTDDIHPSYYAIAEDAAQVICVEITGLDMMIQDIKDVASDNNYGIIEMNFNPAIHIHCFPYKGKNRKLNEKILTSLGF